MYYETNVTVTPGMAREFLERNVENNRTPKTAKIRSYARDMRAGAWRRNTGETIKFDTRRRLIDGQNRLHAVIEANVSVVFDIAHDVSVEVMPVLDSGASRSGKDALSIEAGIRDPRVASLVRWVIMWNAGVRVGKGGTVSPTNSEIVKAYNREPGLLHAAAARGRDAGRAGLGTGGSAAMAFYLFSFLPNKVSKGDSPSEDASAFFDMFVSGAGLPTGHPILTLRNRMVKTKIDRLTRPEELVLIVRGWNAWRKGETPGGFLLPKNGVSNADFPLPK
jgi:hypothetical protein